MDVTNLRRSAAQRTAIEIAELQSKTSSPIHIVSVGSRGFYQEFLTLIAMQRRNVTKAIFNLTDPEFTDRLFKVNPDKKAKYQEGITDFIYLASALGYRLWFDEVGFDNRCSEALAIAKQAVFKLYRTVNKPDDAIRLEIRLFSSVASYSEYQRREQSSPVNADDTTESSQGLAEREPVVAYDVDFELFHSQRNQEKSHERQRAEILLQLRESLPLGSVHISAHKSRFKKDRSMATVYYNTQSSDPKADLQLSHRQPECVIQ